ncbi:endonuclease/exonuclease/phosphatase family protein, partial [candidate division KSB1 bacterium]
IMTFNIHHGEGTDRVYDIGRIARFLREHQAELIGCQEVDNKYSERSRNEDQPEMLKGVLGFQIFYGPNIRENYGNLILSKYPILEAKNVKLPNPEEKEPRGLIIASINVKNRSIFFLNTHLSASSPVNRASQVQHIRKIVIGMHKPVILVGDFNTRPSRQLQPLLEEGLLYSTRGILELKEGIDDILVSEKLRNLVLEGKLVPNKLSDHSAYWIDIDIGKIIE